MATKIIKASDILKVKGFTPAPFDTAGFAAAVQGFFLKPDTPPHAKFLIKPYRFSDAGVEPPGGFISTYPDDDASGVRWMLPPLGFAIALKEGRAAIIDEPYFNNAVALLRMYGYIVSRPKGGIYTVTLV